MRACTHVRTYARGVGSEGASGERAFRTAYCPCAHITTAALLVLLCCFCCCAVVAAAVVVVVVVVVVAAAAVGQTTGRITRTGFAAVVEQKVAQRKREAVEREMAGVYVRARAVQHVRSVQESKGAWNNNSEPCIITPR